MVDGAPPAPRLTDEKVRRPVCEENPRGRRMSVTGSAPRDAVRVLLVTGNQEVRRSMVDNPQSRGCRVSSAYEARDALGRAAQDPPGMVLVEMRSRGLVNRKFIRSISLGHDIPVILIAGEGTQDVEKAFEVGADDCITDPLSRGETLARINEALRRRSDHRAGRSPGILRLGKMTISHPERAVTLSGRRCDSRRWS